VPAGGFPHAIKKKTADWEKTMIQMHRTLLTSAFALALPLLLSPAPPAAAQETITLKLWSRADNSGPLRPGNILKGADALNQALEAEGADYRVAVEVLEQPNEGGYDSDAERLLRAFAIGDRPDFFHAAHEWVCAFADSGYLYDLTDYIKEHPEYFGDIVPSLWESTECGGRRYAVPQDAEARMFYYNKDLMREAGYDDAFIEGLDEEVLAGEVTLDDMTAIAQKVVESTDAEYGILHRPSRGPDYIMPFFQYGNSFLDPESGKLLLEYDKLAATYGWFARNVEAGVTPANNTSLEWPFIRDQMWKEGKVAMWMYGIWELGSEAFPRGVPSDQETFFQHYGWSAAPAAEKGGEPGSLTHPIVYVVAAGDHAEIAARIVGLASDASLNTDHAVSTTHLGVKTSQIDDPRYQEQWPLALATPLLDITSFLPNHADFGALNQIIYEGLQGVESGQLSAEDAADFVITEAEARIPDSIEIK
jgi:inositol-phosphate transport system substrate-binding protein